MSALIISNARVGNDLDTTTLYVENGRFVAALGRDTATCESLDLEGRLLLPGLIETHIHLDKACIMQRCQLQAGTLAEAVQQTRAAKAEFTEQDVYQRGA
jgi:cytosine deaminase